jgi:hypothetical protein
MNKPRAESFFEGKPIEYMDTKAYSPGGEILQVTLGLKMGEKVNFDKGFGCLYSARLKVDFVPSSGKGSFVEWERSDRALLVKGNFDYLFEMFVNQADSIYTMLGVCEGKNPLKKDLMGRILRIEANVRTDFYDKVFGVLREDLKKKFVP